MKNAFSISALIVSFLSVTPQIAPGEDTSSTIVEKELAADLELLQGSWEMLHGNQKKGQPNNTRSVKTIKGNKETLRRYSVKTGKLTHEHSVEFKLSRSGSVHVFTFFRVGGSAENGASFVYKVDKENFYDITGLLRGDQYRNYQSKMNVWHWKRILETKLEDTTNTESKSAN